MQYFVHNDIFSDISNKFFFFFAAYQWKFIYSNLDIENMEIHIIVFTWTRKVLFILRHPLK